MYTKDQSNEGTKQDYERMKTTAAQTKDDLGQLAQEAGQYARRFVNATNEAARTGFTQAKSAARTQMREKPLQSSLIALGVGFLLGAMFKR